jgi:hypothetical protein
MIRPMSIDPHAASAHTTQTGPRGVRAEECACRTEAAESAARDRRMLEELAGIGLGIARSLQVIAEAQAAQVVAEPTQIPAGIDPGLGFSRVSRAVRLTLALKVQLMEGAPERDRKEREAVQERKIAAARKHRKKIEVARAVEMAIADDAERGEGGNPEELRADLRERLDEVDIDDDLGKLKISEIVERICRDLRIEPDWRLWREEAWFVEEGFVLEDDDGEEDEEEDEVEDEAAEEPVDAERDEPEGRRGFPIEPASDRDVSGGEEPAPPGNGRDPPESEDG